MAGSINIPRPHAELIKAWADGATIQYNSLLGDWITVDDPSWLPVSEYRVKPEPKPDVWCKWDSRRVSSQMLLVTEFLINGETGALMNVRMKGKDSGNV